MQIPSLLTSQDCSYLLIPHSPLLRPSGSPLSLLCPLGIKLHANENRWKILERKKKRSGPLGSQWSNFNLKTDGKKYRLGLLENV